MTVSVIDDYVYKSSLGDCRGIYFNLKIFEFYTLKCTRIAKTRRGICDVYLYNER